MTQFNSVRFRFLFWLGVFLFPLVPSYLAADETPPDKLDLHIHESVLVGFFSEDVLAHAEAVKTFRTRCSVWKASVITRLKERTSKLSHSCGEMAFSEATWVDSKRRWHRGHIASFIGSIEATPRDRFVIVHEVVRATPVWVGGVMEFNLGGVLSDYNFVWNQFLRCEEEKKRVEAEVTSGRLLYAACAPNQGANLLYSPRQVVIAHPAPFYGDPKLLQNPSWAQFLAEKTTYSSHAIILGYQPYLTLTVVPMASDGLVAAPEKLSLSGASFIPGAAGYWGEFQAMVTADDSFKESCRTAKAKFNQFYGDKYLYVTCDEIKPETSRLTWTLGPGAPTVRSSALAACFFEQ